MSAKSSAHGITAGHTASRESHRGWILPARSLAVMQPSGLLGQWRRQLKAVWRRHHHQRIQHAIRTYSFEKHCLTRGFRPAAALSTVRHSIGEIERNKLPLGVEWTGPWQVRPASAEEGPAQKENRVTQQR